MLASRYSIPDTCIIQIAGSQPAAQHRDCARQFSPASLQPAPLVMAFVEPEQPEQAFEYAHVDTWAAGDPMPGNPHWKKLPPLQTQRVLAGDDDIWLGSIPVGDFEKYVKETWSHAACLYAGIKSGKHVLVRMAPTAPVVLNVHGSLLKNSVRIAGKFMSGVDAFTCTYPMEMRLLARHVRRDAYFALLDQNLMHTTQTVILLGPGGRLQAEDSLWGGRPTTSSEIYAKKKPRKRLTQKTNLRSTFLKRIWA